MKYIHRLLIITAILLPFFSCAELDESNLNFIPEKTEEVAMREFINQYDVLKTYVNRDANPDFELGLGMSVSDFLKKETVFSLALTNFDEISSKNSINHGNVVKNDGSLDFTTFRNYIEIAAEAKMSVFGHALCWHANQNAIYLNELIAPIILPSEESEGTTVIADFESDAIGNTYDMTNGGSATVVTDPAGADNQVLNVISNQSHPIFSVALPNRITLGDCTKISLKFYGTGSTGRYGQGMRLSINGSSLFNFRTPADYGCQDNKWGDINLDLSTITLSPAQKQLTEFTIAVGSATGAGNYFIDDVVIHWERNNIIEKTPEEKEELISEALETWIAGLMETNGGFVKAWDVVNEPMSDDDNLMLRSEETDPNPDNNFYWPDYLGDNYAQYAVNYARQYFKEYGGNETELKLFVNDYGLEKDGSRKCERLIEMIEQWETKNIVIDGIGTEMNLTHTLDPISQEQNKNNIIAMFQKLTETGKLIRISGLTISVEDKNGTLVKTADLTFAQQQAVSDYYDFIVRKYFEIIPAAQRYGITIANPVDTSDAMGLWNNGYNRRYTYTGFADGLAGE